ncbi:MAG: glycosyltransferase family 2 protein [Cyanobacteria bacterium J06626_6]
MMTPLLSIIIPTYNRPVLLQRAVRSALAQTLERALEGAPEGESEAAIEVLVVDDCSPLPVTVVEHPRLSLVRLPVNSGGAAARNEGARLARGKYISYLDDDDQLLPGMAQRAIAALKQATLPQPVAVLGGIEVINSDGRVESTRLPPTLPKGAHFALEEAQPGKSFLCKQTMVVERSVLLGMGGFDESFQSRVHTELFFRLNQVCSIVGMPAVTYQLTAHEGPRVSRNPALRQLSFEQLVAKHRALFEAHPPQFALFVYRHAQILLNMGQRKAALSALLWALKIHPPRSLSLLAYELKERFLSFPIAAYKAVQSAF